MTVSLRLNENDSKLVKAYAEINGLSVSELFRKAVLERIEDEYDLKVYNEAMEEFKKDPVTHSFDEVMRELDT